MIPFFIYHFLVLLLNSKVEKIDIFELSQLCPSFVHLWGVCGLNVIHRLLSCLSEIVCMESREIGLLSNLIFFISLIGCFLNHLLLQIYTFNWRIYPDRFSSSKLDRKPSHFFENDGILRFLSLFSNDKEFHILYFNCIL